MATVCVGSLKKNSRTYFYSSFLAYIFGLGLTIFVMHTFKHAQVRRLQPRQQLGPSRQLTLWLRFSAACSALPGPGLRGLPRHRSAVQRRAHGDVQVSNHGNHTSLSGITHLLGLIVRVNVVLRIRLINHWTERRCRVLPERWFCISGLKTVCRGFGAAAVARSDFLFLT